MVRFTLYLTERQMRDAKALAAKQGISFSELVRRSLDRDMIAERATAGSPPDRSR